MRLPLISKYEEAYRAHLKFARSEVIFESLFHNFSLREPGYL